MKRFFILLVSVLFLSAIYSADKFDALLGDLREADTASSSLPATSILDAVGKALTENSEWGAKGATGAYSGRLPSGSTKVKVLVRNDGATPEYTTHRQLLLHFDSFDGDAFASTAFKDSSINNRTPTIYGNIQIDIDRKFGSGAALFDGSGDYLKWTVPAIGTGDFTFEWWGKATSTDDRAVFGFAEANGFDLYDDNAGTVRIGFNGSNIAAYSGHLSTASYKHYALVRYNGTITFYENGAQFGTPFADTNNATATTLQLGKGRYNDHNGRIDEFAFYTYAKYTTTFDGSLPTRQFENAYPLTIAPATGKQIKKWTTDADHSIILSEFGQTVELDRDSNGDWWPRLLIGSTPTEQAD